MRSAQKSYFGPPARTKRFTFLWMSLVCLPSFLPSLMSPFYLNGAWHTDTESAIGLLATIKDRVANGFQWGINYQRRADRLCERAMSSVRGWRQMCPPGKCRLWVLGYAAHGSIHTWVITHIHILHTLTVCRRHTHSSGHRAKWALRDVCLGFMINADCTYPWQVF